MPRLRKIARLFAMEWSDIIQYRTDVFLWMSVEAIIPLIALAIWYTVAQSSDAVAPIDIFTYYILVIFIKIATDAWNGYIMARDILDGKIIKYLIRPLSVFWKHIANDLMEKAMKLLIPLPIFVLVVAVLPQYFSAHIYQWDNIVLFCISLILAMSINFAADGLIGLVAFWLEDPLQIRAYKFMFEYVASGILIPFSLLPPLAHSLFSFLPFRYVISAPAEMLLGQVQGTEALSLLLVQGVWVAVLVGISRILWVRGLQRYAIPGQ